MSLFFATGTNAVAYNGVACTLPNAKSGQYAGVRNLWHVTNGPAAGEVANYINWVQNSKAARKIIASNWVPLN